MCKPEKKDLVLLHVVIFSLIAIAHLACFCKDGCKVCHVEAEETE